MFGGGRILVSTNGSNDEFHQSGVLVHITIMFHDWMKEIKGEIGIHELKNVYSMLFFVTL